MEEIWRDIVNYEGKYQISNLGRVKSLRRESWNGHVMIINRERILRPRMRKEGKRSRYASVMLSNGQFGQRSYQIHTLVWDHFNKIKRDGHKILIDHINNNQLDNRIENLQLVTQRENVHKSIKRGTRNKTSKYIGVCFRHNTWNANISINGKRIDLGCFLTEEDAHKAYLEELKKVA